MTENTLPPKQTIRPGEKGDMQPPSDWQTGETILDTYEVKGTLGKGGFGKVYRVHHKSWNIDLAVKRALTLEEENKQSFIDEAQHWIDLGLHPHIISCYYVRNIDGFPHTFAELAEGRSLHDWIQRDSYDLYEGGKDQALQRTLDIAIQFAWGLAYAHQQELVHQDVKPQNALMTPGGILKVTDFGLAKARGSAQAGKQQAPAGDLLVSGGAYSPYHCSPEQAAGEKLSLKTDIWSWAVSVLEMFNGGVSWMGGQVADTALESYLQRAGEEEDIPPMPQGLADLLRKCLLSDPKARPVDMLTVAEQLLPIYQQETGQAYPRQMPKAAELRADSLNNKALSMLDLGKEDVAKILIKEALEADSTNPNATYNLSLMQWQGGEIDDLEVIHRMETALTAQPNRWPTAYLLSLVHMQRGDPQQALESLDGLDAQPEAKHLTALVNAKLPPVDSIRTFEGHTEEVNTFAISPDGRTAVSGGKDKTLRIWDLKNGNCLKILEGHRISIHSVAISPDGKRAVSGGAYDCIYLWDLIRGECINKICSKEELATSANSVAFTPDGRHILSGNYDQTVRLWDPDTGDCLHTFSGHKYQVNAIAITPDGRLAVSGSDDDTLRVWNLASGHCVHTLEGHTDTVSALVITPDGRRVVSGSHDRTVRVWDLESGKCLHIFESHECWVKTLAITPDGKMIVIGGSTGNLEERLIALSLENGRCLRSFEGHKCSVNAVAITSSGAQFLSGAWNRVLRLWDLKQIDVFQAPFRFSKPVSGEAAIHHEQDFNLLIKQASLAYKEKKYSESLYLTKKSRSLPTYERAEPALKIWKKLYKHCKHRQISGMWLDRTYKVFFIEAIEISPNGRRALLGGHRVVGNEHEFHELNLLDLENGKCLLSKPGYPPIAISPDGRYALSGHNDPLNLWDLETGECVRTYHVQIDSVNSIAFSPSGNQFLTGGSEKHLKLWDLATGQCLCIFEGHKNEINSVAFSPDGRQVLSGGGSFGEQDNRLRLWDISTGACIHTLEDHQSYVNSIAFSPDGSQALSGSNDKTLKLWGLETGTHLRTLEGHANSVNSVVFSSDGRQGFSGSTDKTLKLWDLETGVCLRTLEGHTHYVKSVALSFDGSFALSGGFDQTLKMWALDWELEDYQPADWDESARPYLEIFLTLHTPCGPDGFTRQGKPVWTEEEFQSFLVELGYRGYGWLRAEGVRKKLAEMAAERD